ncbi:HNH endonuclease [Bacillus sp. FJAT-29814]|uniref:HNH endonuclease n=1 Tax=Bacillus sp. FJAT-29814 TaxID=1729688 RepID=UPI00082B6D13|nr:HNH endonuclease [Bacillus sp. FJAT-29814]
MAWTKICSGCGKRIEYNATCNCKNHIRNKSTEGETDKLMRSSRWKKKRRYIIDRDICMCQRCFWKYQTVNITELTVHHIHSRKNYPELMWEDSNLICVCMTCNNQLKKVKDGTLDFDWTAPEEEYHL